MARTWKTVLIHHILDREIRRCAEEYLRGRLIDIGCGTKPYRDMLAYRVEDHTGLDRKDPFNPAAEIDILGTAYNIPVPDASFDSAVCTAVLEHLADPEAALRECLRVLKQGGVAVYAVPLFWHVHAEPWDYYRFTRYGLQHLFEKAGFEVLEINALAGFWATFATMFAYYLERFHRGPLRYVPLIPALGLAGQAVALVLERIDRAEPWTWMYTLVARKP